MYKFNARYTTESDYDNILVKWWGDNRFVPPPQDSLPNNGVNGIIVSNEDGIDICAGFVYETNSKTAWCEYIVADFNYRDGDRAAAIEYLIYILTAKAKENGYKYVYTNLKNTALISKYKSCGYVKGSENCTEMIKIFN